MRIVCNSSESFILDPTLFLPMDDANVVILSDSNNPTCSKLVFCTLLYREDVFGEYLSAELTVTSSDSVSIPSSCFDELL